MAWLAEEFPTRPECTCYAGEKCAVCRAWRPGRRSSAIARGDAHTPYQPQPSPLVALIAEALAAAPDGLMLRELRSHFSRGETSIREALRILRDDKRAHSSRRGHRTVWVAGPAPEGVPVPPKTPRVWETPISRERQAFFTALKRMHRAGGKRKRARDREDVIQLGILYYRERGAWPNTRRLREDYALPTIDTVSQLFGGLRGYIAACEAAMAMDTPEERRG